MKYSVVFTFLFLLHISSAFSQEKIYKSLENHFPGIKKETIRIRKDESGNSKASFLYKQKKHIVSFTADNHITSSKHMIEPSELPASVIQDLNCFYERYNIEETSVTHYYDNDELAENIDTNVVIGFQGAEETSALIYTNGERPENVMYASREEEGFEFYAIARLGLRPCEQQNWYGGSAEAFCDSLQKYVQIENDPCMQHLAGSRFMINLTVAESGEIDFSTINALTPFVFDKKLEQYFRSIRFPEQPERDSLYSCAWSYKVYVTIAENGSIIVTPSYQ